MGARAAILDCEASICNRELAAAPTPPRLPSRWQIIAQVEECAPPSVSGRQAGLEWHAGARMALLGFRGGCGRRKLARGAWDYTGGWVSAGFRVSLGTRWEHPSSFTFTLARKSEISFHRKCEVKVKVKPIRCFHVKSRTLPPASDR